MILARKGTKAPQRVIGGSGRKNITIHTCFSASGQYYHLMFIKGSV